MESKKDSDK